MFLCFWQFLFWLVLFWLQRWVWFKPCYPGDPNSYQIFTRTNKASWVSSHQKVLPDSCFSPQSHGCPGPGHMACVAFFGTSRSTRNVLRRSRFCFLVRVVYLDRSPAPQELGWVVSKAILYHGSCSSCANLLGQVGRKLFHVWLCKWANRVPCSSSMCCPDPSRPPSSWTLFSGAFSGHEPQGATKCAQHGWDHRERCEGQHGSSLKATPKF